MDQPMRIEIQVDVNNEVIKPYIRKIADENCEGTSPVLLFKNRQTNQIISTYDFMIRMLMDSKVKLNGLNMSNLDNETIYVYLRNGLLSMVQTFYSFIANADGVEWVSKKNYVGVLLDNDSLFGNHYISLSSNPLIYYQKSHFEDESIQHCELLSKEFKINFLEEEIEFKDAFPIDRDQFPSFPNTSIVVEYTVYPLIKLNVTDFNNRPGNFSLPIFTNDKSLEEFSTSRSHYEIVVRSFTLAASSVFAAAFDLVFQFENNPSNICVKPRGSLFFTVYGGFREPYELAYTPNLFVLRSRYIRKNLRLINVKYTQWYITFEIVNISENYVDLFTRKQCKNEDFRVLSFVTPSQPRILMYQRLGNLFGFDINNEKDWVFNFIEKIAPQFSSEEFIGNMDKILEGIFGVKATILNIYKKEKIQVKGEEKKHILFAKKNIFGDRPPHLISLREVLNVWNETI